MISQMDGLIRALRPPVHGGDQVDWSAWRDELGFDFPSDYRRFMEVYGGGGIDQYLGIMSLSGDGKDWRDEYGNVSAMFGERASGASVPCPYPAYSGLGGLVSWGVSAGPEFFYWLADSRNPDDWPVVIWSRSEFEWYRHDDGFSSFLLSALEGRLDDDVFNREGFPSDRRDYLNYRDEKTLAGAGVQYFYYDISPGLVIEQCRAAGINPVDFFQSAGRYE